MAQSKVPGLGPLYNTSAANWHWNGMCPTLPEVLDSMGQAVAVVSNRHGFANAALWWCANTDGPGHIPAHLQREVMDALDQRLQELAPLVDLTGASSFTQICNDAVLHAREQPTYNCP